MSNICLLRTLFQQSIHSTSQLQLHCLSFVVRTGFEPVSALVSLPPRFQLNYLTMRRSYRCHLFMVILIIVFSFVLSQDYSLIESAFFYHIRSLSTISLQDVELLPNFETVQTSKRSASNLYGKFLEKT
jgi:hypothetical protein